MNLHYIYHRHINVYSHTFKLLWEPRKPRRKLIAHQCCDQLTAVKTRYPLTSITWPYRELRCRPIQVEYFLKLSADKLLVFRWSQAQVYFLKFIWNMLCLCHYGLALLTFWFQTDLGRENSASCLKMQEGKTDGFHFSQDSHALVTLHVQFLCPDWSKFGRWVHAENSYNIVKLVCFNSWSWQSFVSTCDVLNNCLFPLDVQNEIQLLPRVFCYLWLVSLLNFWLRNALL